MHDHRTRSFCSVLLAILLGLGAPQTMAAEVASRFEMVVTGTSRSGSFQTTAISLSVAAGAVVGGASFDTQAGAGTYAYAANAGVPVAVTRDSAAYETNICLFDDCSFVTDAGAAD